ncbi:hypothetical protein [Anatilimnocola floriformis]|uniref:hypothetical protein n=1 Tax=Anatilimnocola floriformis TaxID=2948575 RepID=UPI0020C43A6C|nr:hypothetical protein [Anatilimnocola floriformis]
MSMQETAKQLFKGLGAVKEAALAIAPGLKDLGADVGAEVSRLGTQGSMEIANVLFNGQAFVPYGPGQYTPDQQQSQHQEHSEPQHSLEQERGGIER